MSTPTVVLLHGQPDTSASFQPLRRRLRAELPGVRVLAPDRPGYGANTLPVRGYPGNADWLLRWLDAADAGPTVLLGHSWAGGVALLAAAQAPDRITGLVLLASVGPSCLLAVDRVLALPAVGELLSWGILHLGRPMISRRARHLVTGNQDIRDQPFARTSGLAMRHRPVWRSFLAEQRALVTGLPELERSLAAIRRPTMVISGSRDPLIPRVTPALLQQRIAGATAHVIAGGGHDLQLREPDAVARLVAPFAGPLLQPSAGREPPAAVTASEVS